MNLVQRFRLHLQSNDLLPEDGRLILGVSGGLDSITMLHLFALLAEELAQTLYVVHVHHGLHGQADAAAEFVKQVCEAWDIEHTVSYVDVPTLVEENAYSVEDAARRARYQALAAASFARNARTLVTAHTADDQAETILMHLIRGSGLQGLIGMVPQSPLTAAHTIHPPPRGLTLLRPLLPFTRVELKDYHVRNQLQYHVDPTNTDLAYTRNYVRHEIIPRLKSINPDFTTALMRLSDVLSADCDYLEQGQRQAWDFLLRHQDDEAIYLDRKVWQSLPLAMQRMTLRHAAGLLLPVGVTLGYQHIEIAIDLIMSDTDQARIDLPALLTLYVEGNDIILSDGDMTRQTPDWPLLPPEEELFIPGPGTYALPTSDWSLHIQPYDEDMHGPDWQRLLADPWAVPLDASRLRYPLTIRTRRSGDRFAPQGVDGTQKIGDFQTNHKIPAGLRDHLPLLLSGDEIAWVCGWRTAQPYVVKMTTENVVVARFSR